MLRLENYFVVANITDNKVKQAALLHYVGEWVFDIFLSLPDTGEADNYQQAVAALNNYFIPKKNTNYEISKLREAVQQPSETLNQFSARLRELARTSNFHPVDNEVKSQIISKCCNKRLRQRALETFDITLNKLLEMGNVMESAEKQAESIEDQIKPSKETLCRKQSVETKSLLFSQEGYAVQQFYQAIFKQATTKRSKNTMLFLRRRLSASQWSTILSSLRLYLQLLW